ncbi:hypothetical protein SO802_023111 [Lithocarpus litseifolius]|uniref:Aminotransferase-like plant mobile domain-containing protein n=1 Tax=Lithocarpus litseifolius TaxID=425828 RepID=A0AAW2C7A4_9ROSI
MGEVSTHMSCDEASTPGTAPRSTFYQEPYRNYFGFLAPYCIAGQHIWRSIVLLIHFWVVEGHHLERVLRQLGMKQGILVDVDTSIELHKITLRGKQDKNWFKEHAMHIAKWATHATIADAPPFHGEMSYNDKYMGGFIPALFAILQNRPRTGTLW